MIGLGAPDPAAVKRGEELIVPLAAVLDQHLVGRTWVAQDKVTLADFALATPLMSMDRARLPVKDRPNLMRWFARVQELDAWKKTNP
jgi:glutathione S-transferase